MNVKKVQLINFRNYQKQDITFCDGLNIIVGNNASGKTNMVESVYYSGLGKSPRTFQDKELVKWGEESAYIKIEIEKKYRNHIIEINIDKIGKKRIAVDKIPVRKINELIGMLNVVYFSPDELDIIKESPVLRRNFLNISLSQQKKSYYFSLVRYNKILAQRNKLLKDEYDTSVIKETLPIWDSQLAEIGTNIIIERYEFCEKMQKIIELIHSELTGGEEVLTMEYESKIKLSDRESMKEEFLKLLSESYDKDIHLKYTTVGCHRDDINIKINDIEVRKFGSQGQKRTTALSLKLAEVKLFELVTGEKPILILDDVLSELDSKRQNKLLEHIRGVQTLLTCAGYNGKYDKIIVVDNGMVTNNNQ
ncbi:MAG TPA: DNA replication/repair protein RecF [Clostridia bacterium]|nr:DNA replication/repair protein RecF [Clostridia bacterium]